MLSKPKPLVFKYHTVKKLKINILYINTGITKVDIFFILNFNTFIKKENPTITNTYLGKYKINIKICIDIYAQIVKIYISISLKSMPANLFSHKKQSFLGVYKLWI